MIRIFIETKNAFSWNNPRWNMYLTSAMLFFSYMSDYVSSDNCTLQWKNLGSPSAKHAKVFVQISVITLFHKTDKPKSFEIKRPFRDHCTIASSPNRYCSPLGISKYLQSCHWAATFTRLYLKPLNTIMVASIGTKMMLQNCKQRIV